MEKIKNSFRAKSTLSTASGEYEIFCLDTLEKQGLCKVSSLPYSIRVLLENVLRNEDGFQVTKEDVIRLAKWDAKKVSLNEIPFKPGRVILQDFTGVPAVVDLAALRSAMKRLGGDPKKINPSVPCDLIIDHSVQVDFFNSKDALEKNVRKEFERNRERYEFLRWGQKAFQNFRVVPPSTGIIHQINLEYLSKCVLTKACGKSKSVFPDTLVGTDSHTTMINGLGVLGWGVGGIEAEAVMLGQPIYMLMPEVVGFKLKGKLQEGVTATDLVLTVTQVLRQKGVVGKFVEYFGPGLSGISLADRAVLSNMAPEYGATMGFMPVDKETIQYLRLTGRSDEEVDLAERYTKKQKLFRETDAPDPTYSDVIELDLSSIKPSLAGPKRPQDRILLSEMKENFVKTLTAPVKERGFALEKGTLNAAGAIKIGEYSSKIKHGAVAIASITSCTNTSSPALMIGAGLVAKKAYEKGLVSAPYVKGSLAPGSRVVTEYLEKAGLLSYLEKTGFSLVGYGCATCIGNSGALPAEVGKAISENNLIAASVLSGNRNFEGRINPLVKANYLASPPLVVAFALAGKVDIDLDKEPLGKDKNGKDVFLKDIWPSSKEIENIIAKSVDSKIFQEAYQNIFDGPEEWKKLPEAGSELFNWEEKSTYIQEPPFFTELTKEAGGIKAIGNARALLMVGDSVTTDHISPAGAIKTDSPAGKFLQNEGVKSDDFNSYGSRRGNDRVMTRGTFANIRLRNLLAPGTEGGWTQVLPEGKQTTVYEAALAYKKQNIPLVILAGKEYGTGSSRDWAAKGTYLLGVRAVLAESYERIHRSNLVGMGILPLQFRKGETRESLTLTGKEEFNIQGLDNSLKPLQEINVVAKSENGGKKTFSMIVRIDTPVEIEYYRNGGILQTVLRKLLKD